ncbi:MAG: glycosyltransferase, partial [Armatimonadetes bacterium]|nr:glycosyltransferase [Armatimonadota bacterium]
LIPFRFSGRSATTLNLVLYIIKKLSLKFVAKTAVKKAKKIITVSKYTKNDVLNYFGVQSKKIEVIYEGAPQSKVKS